jgi:basic amino acid/polyamine antiporter, APA family
LEQVKAVVPPSRGALVRQLTRSDALAIGIGSVIGTGIFRATGEVLRGAGGFAAATLIWLGVGAISAMGAAVYADMASRVPEAGGPYAYVREAFGRYAAFLDGGLTALVSIPARHAAAIGVIGEVVARLTHIDHPRAWAVLALVSLVTLNLPGVREGATAQRFFTVAKLALVAGVIALAIVSVGAPERTAETMAALPPVSLATAVAAAWYSYLGWQDTALLTEEMKEPARDLRFVMVATVGVVAAAYVGVHVALFLGLRGDEASRGALPAVGLARRVLGPVGETAMTVGLLVSMIGGAAESLLVRPRVLFALARDGFAPKGLTYVNRGGTPALAMLAHGALVLALVLTGTFRDLIALVAFTQALTGLAEASSAFVLVAPRPRRASSLASTAGFVAANAALCVLLAYEDPRQIGYALASLLLLTLVYPLVRHANRSAAKARPTPGRLLS